MRSRLKLLYSALHGTAIRYAVEHRYLAAAIAELREIAGGRNDVLAELLGSLPDRGMQIRLARSVMS